MEKETLQVSADTKKILVHDVKRHLEIDFPLLKERVSLLEKDHDSIKKTQGKVFVMESKVNALSCKVETLTRTITNFCKEMKDNFDNFKTSNLDSNTSFKRWLIGTVLLSLILGLFCQYFAFHQVHESIHNLDTKIMKVIIENSNKKVITP